jgi:hypothetical protein
MDAAIAHAWLLASVRKNPDTGCWDWAGQVSNSGYRRAMPRDADVSTRMESAHRARCELFVGPGPPGRSELRQPPVHRPRSPRIDRCGGERLTSRRA